MKYPLFFGASISLSMIATAIFFIVINPSSFFQDPFSVVGNLPNMYHLFVILGILLSLSISAFLYGSFSFFHHLTRKVQLLILSAVLSGIFVVLVPYTKENVLFEIIHTFLAVIGAVLVVLLSVAFKEIPEPKKQVLSFIKKYTPPALSIGTISLFLISGISMLMETYFVFIMSIWLFIMGLMMKEEQT